MKSKEIRDQFLEFFRSKEHLIVSSAPIVNKNDPTLMFTNAGMNQFKDAFLGNENPKAKRIADTQKCLRVSGKHNDLEEVGKDSYHHTMFEMLGNWSFGDYFKKEAINWAWELLVNVYKLNPDRIYATVFGGDENDGLAPDKEAFELWKNWLEEDKILYFDRKDNFWEMGDIGPCGPCSELHIDLRTDEEIAASPGRELVNKDHPQIIEIWNLVFIQFNRKADGSLVELPAKHIDTGMGFERLCMAIQGKISNYDTDLFTPYIQFIEKRSGYKYNNDYSAEAKSDIAMRVAADHIRAVSFAIADGAMPSNTGAGYVIRRILRRAVRYYHSFLNIKEPFLFEMVPMLAGDFESVFPNLKAQLNFVTKVIKEEEKSFLRTLDEGLKRFENLEVNEGVIDGKAAFELFDTYGFPIDLTRLMAEEKNYTLDEKGFEEALAAQRERGREDAKKQIGDWHEIGEKVPSRFFGYDQLNIKHVRILRYRTVMQKGKEYYQLVLDKTPFYPEGGGQVGDTGILRNEQDVVRVINTLKENELIIHIVDQLPRDIGSDFEAIIDVEKRKRTENNHSATHLMHAALRKVLGPHVQQKGSLVNSDHLRFDFSHFQKMTDDEIEEVERLVNQKIRENIVRGEDRYIPIEDAKAAGAMMLFGEKYGDKVRMITFDPSYSIELCGGCHVNHTGQIGLFKIIGESAIAAGVRRIEAVTANAAETYIHNELNELRAIRQQLKSGKNVVQVIASLQQENKTLKKKIEKLNAGKVGNMKSNLKAKFQEVNGMNVLIEQVPIEDGKALKTLAFNLEKETKNAVIFFAANTGNKPQLLLNISKNLVEEKGLHAGNIIRELAAEIKGGGGGQAFFASAGGKDVSGLPRAVTKAKEMLL